MASKPTRDEYLRTHPVCEIGELLTQHRDVHRTIARAADNCFMAAQGIHERQKRSHQGSLVTPANLMSACNVCNGWVEDHPLIARYMGLTVWGFEDPQEVPRYPQADALDKIAALG